MSCYGQPLEAVKASVAGSSLGLASSALPSLGTASTLSDVASTAQERRNA